MLLFATVSQNIAMQKDIHPKVWWQEEPATIRYPRETDPKKVGMTYGQILDVMKKLNACNGLTGTKKSLEYCNYVINGLSQKDQDKRPEFVNDFSTMVIMQAIFYGYPEAVDAVERSSLTEVALRDHNGSIRNGLKEIIEEGHRKAAAEFARILEQPCA